VLMVNGATSVFAQEGGIFREPESFGRGINYAIERFGGEGPEKDGFYPEFGNMITGSGWLSVGPGFRKHFFGNGGFFDASTAVSWRAYKMAQARVEFSRLAGNHVTLGSQVMWQDLTQVNYFGLGPDSSLSAASNFRLRNTDAMAYAGIRLGHFSLNARAGWVPRPKVSSATGWHIDYPDTQLLFNDQQAPGIDARPNFVYGTLSIKIDTRDEPDHPSHGHFYRVAMEAFNDRNGGKYTFRRYEGEGGQYIPLAAKRWVLAFREWGVVSTAHADRTVAFYMLPSLGGQDTLRGYLDYRFHDRDLLALDAESRWALFDHVDAAVFLDTGTVAPRVGAFDLGGLKYSAGVGLRIHTRTNTIGRLDIGRSSEGWRFLFKMNEPFTLTRESPRTVIIPFVP